MSIYELPVGATATLSEADVQKCLGAITQYDPHLSKVTNIVRAAADHALVDIYVDDGAVWRLSEHPVGLTADLLVLGERYLTGVLPASIACAYTPECLSNVDDGKVVLRDVDCGEGYRQLRFNEEIAEDDEYYCGPTSDGAWQKAISSGSKYRPIFCDQVSGQYALMRRKII